MKSELLRCPLLPLPLQWRVVRKGQTPMPTSPTPIWLLRINPILQRGRGNLLMRTPLLSFPYVIFVAWRVVCRFVDLGVLIKRIFYV